MDDDRHYFELVYWAIKDHDESMPAGSHTKAGGFWSMPPPAKRKWLAWVQTRAEAGDEQYLLLFQRLVKYRLLE